MDIRVPRLDGIQATRRVCSDPRWSGRVIVLTTYGDDEHVDAFHAGASGFLLKTTTASDLAHAVRSVASRTELLSPEITRRLVAQFMARSRPGRVAPELADLTEREREVFRHLATGRSNFQNEALQGPFRCRASDDGDGCRGGEGSPSTCHEATGPRHHELLTGGSAAAMIDPPHNCLREKDMP